MRVSVVMSDGHAVGTDPGRALDQDRQLLVAVRDRLDGITLHHGWATAPLCNLQAITVGAFLAVESEYLHLSIRHLPLGVVNPIELAEQLATVDHAWGGRFAAGVTVGTSAAFPAYGLDPAIGPSRFAEGLALMRRMWRLEPFAGEGPNFRFGEVHPTLRPVQEGGPPLSLGVTGADEARTAAEHGLRLHVRQQASLGAHDGILSAYRSAGGDGGVSVEMTHAEATPEALAGLADRGCDHVDVRLRFPGDDATVALERVAALATSVESVR